MSFFPLRNFFINLVNEFEPVFFLFFRKFPLVHSDLEEVVPVDTFDTGHECDSVFKFRIKPVDIDDSG